VTGPVPEGYVRVKHSTADVVALSDCADAVMAALASGSLYSWASSHPRHIVLHGRIPAYAAPLLDDGTIVVVRRNHHGGMLARFRGDRFIGSRARSELETAIRLRAAGIATPKIVAYAVYPINVLESRSDVVSLKLPKGRDFGEVLLDHPDDAHRSKIFEAVGALVRSLGANGITHADLNVKNIYVSEAVDGVPTASVLDVDRVRFTAPGKAAQANIARLTRSIDKWRRLRGIRVSDTELAVITGRGPSSR